MTKKKLRTGPLFTLVFFTQCFAQDAAQVERNSSYLRLMVLPYPPMRLPEPYTYPGPSPPVIPPRGDPYSFMSSDYQQRPTHFLDLQNLPKWCRNMWEKEECGMKCWMLRKICRNIAQKNTSAYPLHKEFDSEGSFSIPHPQYKPYPSYYSYYKKPISSITYSKAGLPNTYYANPNYWPKRHHFASTSPFYKYPTPTDNELGLNPYFTYVDGNEKQPTTTTEKTFEENSTIAIKPEETTPKEVISKPKGTFPVHVITSPKYPHDTEVNTLAPQMFEYDQYGNRGYYGDRIYMSAVMPVSGRQHRISDANDYDSFDDFDELMIDP